MKDEPGYSFPLPPPPCLSGILTLPASCSHVEALRRQDVCASSLLTCLHTPFLHGSLELRDGAGPRVGCVHCWESASLYTASLVRHLASPIAMPFSGPPQTSPGHRMAFHSSCLRARRSCLLLPGRCGRRHNIYLQTHGSLITHSKNRSSAVVMGMASAGLVHTQP